MDVTRMSHRRTAAVVAALLATLIAVPVQAASPAPGASSSPAPAASPAPATLPEGTAVGAGTYAYRGMGVDVTFTVPEGWMGASLGPDTGFMLAPRETAAAVTVTAFGGAAFDDPCDPDTLGSIETTASSFIAFLRASRYLDVGEATSVEVDGTSGWAVDVTVPSPGEGSCPTEQPWLWLWAPSATSDFHLDDGEQARFIALDMDGKVIVIVAEAFPGLDYDAFLEMATTVIESMTLSPAPLKLPDNAA